MGYAFRYKVFVQLRSFIDIVFLPFPRPHVFLPCLLVSFPLLSSFSYSSSFILSSLFAYLLPSLSYFLFTCFFPLVSLPLSDPPFFFPSLHLLISFLSSSSSYFYLPCLLPTFLSCFFLFYSLDSTLLCFLFHVFSHFFLSCPTFPPLVLHSLTATALAFFLSY